MENKNHIVAKGTVNNKLDYMYIFFNELVLRAFFLTFREQVDK